MTGNGVWLEMMCGWKWCVAGNDVWLSVCIIQSSMTTPRKSPLFSFNHDLN